ncbi:MAG: tRNA-dihydrouridine synthase 3 [Alyxoria varia]|nr:MAG: tRNA-dihydrouridine synthase 3 [Alyxoria varia]
MAEATDNAQESTMEPVGSPLDASSEAIANDEASGGSHANKGQKRKADSLNDDSIKTQQPAKKKGVAAIKSEYLLAPAHPQPSPIDGRNSRNKKAKLSKHQSVKGNSTKRDFSIPPDAIQLCSTRAQAPEFSPGECKFGDQCRYEHDLRKYLKSKNGDLEGGCPVWDVMGKCPQGFKCRYMGTHSKEITRQDGRTELVLLFDEEKLRHLSDHWQDKDGIGVLNVVANDDKIELRKSQITPLSDQYLTWLGVNPDKNKGGWKQVHGNAGYQEAPMRPSEKRRLYYGPETPVLAPLTTQGNLPFRRLCSDLGAQATWSEMTMSHHLLQGLRLEWALLKAHQTEMESPRFEGKGTIIQEYDNRTDMKFGAQIAGSKPAEVTKATEALTALCPNLRAIDLNCGCPIDTVFNKGAGSALMDNPSRLEKMVRGMNTVSGEVPITAKIRMGTKDNNPNATKIIDYLAWGGHEARRYRWGSPGVAAITLHGRTRQQRYTRAADWKYIANCAAMIKEYNQERDDRADTIREPDERDQAPSNNGTSAREPGGHIYFLGNGDCYSHEDYFKHIDEAGVDSVMVARGALMKPWIFEEIAAGQYLDKSATERLQYVERFAHYGLEYWGSDELGLNTTRKFLLEWLSFSCRYVPVGLLEHLPPNIQDRPPMYQGRNELESLLRSGDHKDWLKITEMFLGKTHKDFKWEPKHKSSSYEVGAEAFFPPMVIR